MGYFYRWMRSFMLLPLFLLMQEFCHAQGLLDKAVSLDVKNKPVSVVLKNIGAQGNFYFSYNSNMVHDDSIVSLVVKNKPVKEVLDMLFGHTYEYSETGKYIVIQGANTQYWYATGYVIDESTGERLMNASVYEKQQFVSTLTNEQGYFRLRLKDRLSAVTLYISRHLYYDTAITMAADGLHELSIGIAPKPVELDSLVVTPHSGIEKNWLSRLLVSSGQRIQSVNLGKYFVDKPYQASILPGVGSHGRMSTQVVNKVSFNLLGGYTAGVNGIEIGGVFNVIKHDVRYAQLGGVANIVGGSVNGVQVAGVYNQVLEASKGWQFAGVCNFVNDSLTGLQVAGVYNHIWGDMKGAQLSGVANLSKGRTVGVQVSGVANYANHRMKGAQVTGVINSTADTLEGAQISGVGNVALGDMDGVQVSGVFNYAKHVKGVQVGLINVADTSSGASIGLLNFVWKGYHKFSVYTNEVLTLNAAAKMGTDRFYNVILAGFHTGEAQKAFSFGYGLGSEQRLSKRFFIGLELTGQQIYLGDWDYANLLCRAQLNLNYRISKYITFYTGPSYNAYYSTQTVFPTGYGKDIRDGGLFVSNNSREWSSWVGWNVGVSFF